MPTRSFGRRADPRPDRHLLQVATTLHPTPTQTATLAELRDRVGALHLALTAWTASGEQQELRALILQAAATDALVPTPAAMLCPSTLSVDDLSTLLRNSMPAQWRLPTPLIRGVASQHLRHVQRWRERSTGHAQLFKPPAPATLHLPLDQSATPVGPMHVHIEGLPELVVADLWHLPVRLTAALTASGEATAHRLQAQAEMARRAAHLGYTPALQELRHLAERHGPLLLHPAPATVLGRDQPQRATHAALRETRLSTGETGWVMQWSLRVPQGWLPAAARREVAGVDVGIQHVLTWVDGVAGGAVRGDLAPMTSGEDAPGLAGAMVRYARFERTRAALDNALLHLLSYRDVAIEGTRWGPLFQHDPAGVAQMQLSGAAQLADWLEVLGSVTGTRVTRVPPEGGSHHCGQCGGAGEMHERLFRCLTCQHMADRDRNAAAYYRRCLLRRQA